MPAVSKTQRRLFALALLYKRGEIPRTDVSDEIVKLSDLPEEKLRDYASTPEKDLPDHVEENMISTHAGFPFGHEWVSTRRTSEIELGYLQKDKAEAEAARQAKPKEVAPKHVDTYDEWRQASRVLQEDAPVGGANGMNTPGMGNADPGSADVYDQGMVMNFEDWQQFMKMSKKTQKGKKEKQGVQTQRPAWELGGKLPVPVGNTVMN